MRSGLGKYCAGLKTSQQGMRFLFTDIYVTTGKLFIFLLL